VHLGDKVARGDPLMTVHAETSGELQYALHYHALHRTMIEVDP
jgi:thymidine phosphorylase